MNFPKRFTPREIIRGARATVKEGQRPYFIEERETRKAMLRYFKDQLTVTDGIVPSDVLGIGASIDIGEHGNAIHAYAPMLVNHGIREYDVLAAACIAAADPSQYRSAADFYAIDGRTGKLKPFFHAEVDKALYLIDADLIRDTRFPPRQMHKPVSSTI